VTVPVSRWPLRAKVVGFTVGVLLYVLFHDAVSLLLRIVSGAVMITILVMLSSDSRIERLIGWIRRYQQWRRWRT
jgi:hypothetical protein